MSKYHNDVAITLMEHHVMINRLLTPELISIDIATFRIGSNPNVVDGVINLPGKIRVLIGLSQADNTYFKPLERELDFDPCVGIGEEIVCKAGRKAEVRTLAGCHTKLWVFYYGNGCVALAGGRNLNYSTWHDLTVQVKGAAARALGKYFESLWKQGTRITPTPLMIDILKERKF